MKKDLNTIKSDLNDTSYGICCRESKSCSELKLKDLSISYGSKKVLNNLNVSFMPCSIHALVGPSGCGKSSLLSAINRLSDEAQNCKIEGSILLGQTDILSPKCDLNSLRRRVGMIFQKPSPFPFSIWKNIEIALKEHKISNKEQIIEESLKAVGLWHEVKDRLHSSALRLSGGQQQRLCIARALALKPEVLLMDEPCSALDPIASGVVEDMIAQMRGSFTIIIVTHNLAQARRISDTTSFFWTKNGVGELIEHQETEKIFSNPQHELTASYISGLRG